MTGADTPAAWGFGLATVDDASGSLVEVFFPEPRLGPDGAPALALGETIGVDGETAGAAGYAELSAAASATDERRGVRGAVVYVAVADLDAPPNGVADGYLRLHLLSHRLVEPRGVNVDGLLGMLPNVAWSDRGPFLADQYRQVAARFMGAGERISIRSVDKIPRMTDYVLPGGVRIADADRVRLGAHLADGTTVMHEGFVNFNAGTLGPSMVEGRISAGVRVGSGSDLGGGASIMGTLSGGGSEVISVGSDCLIGANAGIGVSLGDGCVVEAGLYLTGGTIVTMPDGSRLKARDLSGEGGLLYRRNSVSGAVEALPREGEWGGLNPELHSN